MRPTASSASSPARQLPQKSVASRASTTSLRLGTFVRNRNFSVHDRRLGRQLRHRRRVVGAARVRSRRLSFDDFLSRSAARLRHGRHGDARPAKRHLRCSGFCPIVIPNSVVKTFFLHQILIHTYINFIGFRCQFMNSKLVIKKFETNF